MIYVNNIFGNNNEREMKSLQKSSGLHIVRPLPPEVWEKILQHLRPGDLCSVSLVCHQLRQVASQSKYWSSARLSRHHLRGAGPSPFFRTRRFSNVQKIVLKDLGQVEEASWTTVFLGLASLAKLDSIDLSSNSFSKVTSFGSLLPLVGYMDLSGCQMDQSQLDLLWSRVSLSSSCHTLKLRRVNCSRVPPLLLEQACLSLSALDLGEASLPPRHANILLAAVAARSSLSSLCLSGHHLSSASATLLSRAAAGLERLDLSNGKLSNHQLCELVASSKLQPPSSLRSLRLDKVNLAKFQSLRLESLLGHDQLDSLSLSDCGLLGSQLGTLLHGMASCRRKRGGLHHLSLAGNDLSLVHPQLLANGITSLSHSVRGGFKNHRHGNFPWRGGGGGGVPPFSVKKKSMKNWLKNGVFWAKIAVFGEKISVFGNGSSVEGGGTPLFR